MRRGSRESERIFVAVQDCGGRSHDRKKYLQPTKLAAMVTTVERAKTEHNLMAGLAVNSGMARTGESGYPHIPENNR
jgi:hypothetical protein